MRLEATKRENTYKVWLTDAELHQLRRHAANHRDDLLIQLGSRVGLRAFEIPQVCPQHVNRTDDGRHFRLHVPAGKDTTGSGGKPRDAYLPESVEADIRRHQTAESLAATDPLIDLTTSGVRAVVKRTARRVAGETGDDRWGHVSSHDLRRRFAQRTLVDKQVNPRVVMAVGGWDSFEALKPYLNAPTPDVVNEEFDAAGLS